MTSSSRSACARDGQDNVTTRTLQFNLAYLYDSTVRSELALARYQELHDIERKLNGESHPDTLAAAHQVANMPIAATQPSASGGRNPRPIRRIAAATPANTACWLALADDKAVLAASGQGNRSNVGSSGERQGRPPLPAAARQIATVVPRD
jgi:hypothetical protein